jgi:hypothetical protein
MKTKTQLMKNIFTLSILVLVSLSSFAKDYYIYTAKSSGNWSNSTSWTAVMRNDGVQKDKFIIPGGFTITGDEEVSKMDISDVELQISGQLELARGTAIYLGANSNIQVLSTGSIKANGASQKIFIGADAKYVGNMNKTLTGPVYADYSTGVAPMGFNSFTLLSLNAASARQIDADKSTVIYASNKNITIKFKTEVRSVAVNVVNMNGAIVANETFSKPSSNLNLNMSNLKPGVYVVQLTGNNVATTVKKIFLN